jgi:sugar transferase (PEP-CTERM/EpsH1 system associated)
VKILYLCHRIPYPPNKGEKIRAFHQIRAMAERHEVDVFTLADDPKDLSHKEALGKHCASVTVIPISARWRRVAAIPYLLSGRALSLPCFYSRELAKAVRRQARERSYDRIFLYCSVMGQYLDELPAETPVVADFVDVDSDKWTQYAAYAKYPISAVYRREGRCLRNWERRLSEQVASVLVSTDREARLLRGIAPAARVEAVPNGVDSDYFSPAAVPRTPGPPTIVFTGDMSYFPNQNAVTWFADDVLPKIAAQIPAVRFLVVGRNPGPAVRALERREGVEITGYVPDVRTHLARATVAVAPFHIAAGIQNKILEAMSYGLPVAATPRAAQGLTEGCRSLVQTAESAQDFAATVVSLLQDRELASGLGSAGRERVVEEYSWAGSLRRMLELLEAPLRGGRLRNRALTAEAVRGS